MSVLAGEVIGTSFRTRSKGSACNRNAVECLRWDLLRHRDLASMLKHTPDDGDWGRGEMRSNNTRWFKLFQGRTLKKWPHSDAFEDGGSSTRRRR